MNINEVYFGNYDRQSLDYANKETYLDSLLDELKSYPFPANDSEEARNELYELISASNEVNTSEILEKFQIYDSMFDKYFINKLSKHNIKVEDLEKVISEINNDVLPLIVKLKYHYQRIRPIQLAKLLNVDLIPFYSVTANSPAYPSGHAIQARLYAEVLGNKFPQFYKPLHELATDIMWSRLYMGVHYPSDAQFAEYISQVIVNHPDFKKKYRL